MDNLVITEEVINNMPNPDVLSNENDDYFATIYGEIIHELAHWEVSES